MNVTINGQIHDIEEHLSILALLQQLGMAEKPVVVELNRVALFPRDFSQTSIPANAEIEIVTLAAGG